MATTVRRTVLTLPAAPVGPPNPLPALRPLDEMPTVGERAKADLPREMARQIGYEPLRTLLPVRVLDGYGRDRAATGLDAVVIENDRLRATVLPGLGGRVHSLHHKPTGRELLYRNPVFQPADFALNGAWYSGGIEWNIGATGHTTLSCAPLHAAVVPAPDGGEMVRLWEWERLRDLPFQVDLWLPADSDFLHVGVRIRNPHEKPAPVYWWSNIAVEEHTTTRVLAPADEAWLLRPRAWRCPDSGERSLRRVPVPEHRRRGPHVSAAQRVPRRLLLRSPARGPQMDRRPRTRTGRASSRRRPTPCAAASCSCGAAGAAAGAGSSGSPSRAPAGYAEIQAGLARTQLEHVRLDGGGEFSWLESYGPLSAEPGVVHGDDWAAARAETEGRLADALPREAVDAAYEAWLPCADPSRCDRLATGSGWGALEVLRGGSQTARHAVRRVGPRRGTGALARTAEDRRPSRAAPGHPAGPVARRPALARHAGDGARGSADRVPPGVAQWHAGDLAQAVRSWERGLRLAPSRWPLLRCLAVADQEAGNRRRATDR